MTPEEIALLVAAVALVLALAMHFTHRRSNDDEER